MGNSPVRVCFENRSPFDLEVTNVKLENGWNTARVQAMTRLDCELYFTGGSKAAASCSECPVTSLLEAKWEEAKLKLGDRVEAYTVVAYADKNGDSDKLVINFKALLDKDLANQCGERPLLCGVSLAQVAALHRQLIPQDTGSTDSRSANHTAAAAAGQADAFTQLPRTDGANAARAQGSRDIAAAMAQHGKNVNGAKGFVYEQHQAATFNADAIKKGLDVRAKVVGGSNGPIDVKVSGPGVSADFQLKANGKASGFTSAVRDHAGKYPGLARDTQYVGTAGCKDIVVKGPNGARSTHTTSNSVSAGGARAEAINQQQLVEITETQAIAQESRSVALKQALGGVALAAGISAAVGGVASAVVHTQQYYHEKERFEKKEAHTRKTGQQTAINIACDTGMAGLIGGGIAGAGAGFTYGAEVAAITASSAGNTAAATALRALGTAPVLASILGGVLLLGQTTYDLYQLRNGAISGRQVGRNLISNGINVGVSVGIAATVGVLTGGIGIGVGILMGLAWFAIEGYFGVTKKVANFVLPETEEERQKATLDLLKRIHELAHKALGVKRDDSDEQVRARYRQIAKTYHPDKLPKNSHPRMKDICLELFRANAEAYSLVMASRQTRLTREDLNRDSGLMLANSAYEWPAQEANTPHANPSSLPREQRELYEWLQESGLSEYFAALVQHGYDSMDTIQHMQVHDAVAMINNIVEKPGHRTKFRRALEKLWDAVDTSTQASTLVPPPTPTPISTPAIPAYPATTPPQPAHEQPQVVPTVAAGVEVPEWSVGGVSMQVLPLDGSPRVLAQGTVGFLRNTTTQRVRIAFEETGTQAVLASHFVLAMSGYCKLSAQGSQGWWWLASDTARGAAQEKRFAVMFASEEHACAFKRVFEQATAHNAALMF